MKGARDYTDYVADMLESAQKAREFVAGMTYEKFVADEKTQYAVVRALEVLGEAAKKVPLRQTTSGLNGMPFNPLVVHLGGSRPDAYGVASGAV